MKKYVRYKGRRAKKKKKIGIIGEVKVVILSTLRVLEYKSIIEFSLFDFFLNSIVQYNYNHLSFILYQKAFYTDSVSLLSINL